MKDSNEHRRIRQKVNHALNLSKNDVVLEEGCGKAVWLAEIQSRVRFTAGLDLEKRMLVEARKQSPSSSFVLADLNEGIPFGDGVFSKIGSILVDGYLRKNELACRERYRVLTPGGILAMVTPKKGAKFFKVLAAEARHRKEQQTMIQNLGKLPLALLAVIFGKIAELKAIIGDWHFYEKQELVDLYNQAGFERITCESVYADQAWLLIARKPAGPRA